MPDSASGTGGVWKRIFTDIHFWIPVVVLIAGLAVLNWMQ